MKKESSKTKLGFTFVCPHCGSEHFQVKEGFSLFGQKFQCLKCKGTFRESLKQKAQKSHSVKTVSTGKLKSKKSNKK